MYEPGLSYVRKVQRWVADAGASITFDWTSAPFDGDVTARRVLAEAELADVLDADLVILLGHARGRGAFIEVGVAIGTGKKVWVLDGEPARPSLFY